MVNRNFSHHWGIFLSFFPTTEQANLSFFFDKKEGFLYPEKRRVSPFFQTFNGSTPKDAEEFQASSYWKKERVVW